MTSTQNKILSIDEISKTFSDMKKEIEKLSSDLKSRDTHIRNLQENIAWLQENNTGLQDSVVNQDRRIEMLEAFTCKDNLVIHRLPELYSESARTSVKSKWVIMTACRTNLSHIQRRHLSTSARKLSMLIIVMIFLSVTV